MQLFYTQQITNDSALFDEAESAHALQVLRMKQGDSIRFTDGKGHLFEGHLETSGKKIIAASGIKIIEHRDEPTQKIHIWIAPTKNADRIEWMVEKAVEFGVWAIHPIITSRTIKKNFNTRRLKNIALAGMKQSLQYHLAHISEATDLTKIKFDQLIGERYVAHCLDSHKQELFSQKFTATEHHVFIGPEGDFTTEEVAFMLQQNCIPVSLGNTRLRTETAGLYALMAIQWSNNIMIK